MQIPMSINSGTTRKDFLKQLGTAAAGTSLLLFFDRAQAELSGDELIVSQYTLSPDITYLNHGSIGTIPESVQKHHAKLLALCESNPWLYMWGGEWEEPREVVRQMAADFIGAKSTEIALTHNTTEAFNLLALGLDFKKGDEVLFSNYNHDGASVPFQFQASRRGFKVRRFRIPLQNVESLTPDDWVDFHSSQISESTRLLVIPHVDNMLGVKLPVRRIAAAARQKGVQWIAVDAAQTVGMVPLDVKEMEVDILATSAHKWVQAPKGVSFAYVSERLQPHLSPVNVTWGQERWGDTARKYEDYGTRNLAAVIALGEAIAFQNEIGFREKIGHHEELRSYAMNLAESHPGVKWRSPESSELAAALYAIELTNKKAAGFNREIYQNHGMVLRGFGEDGLNTLRISPNIMNTTDELERLFRLI